MTDRVRPQSWAEYIGQDRLKARFQTHIAAARVADERLVHTLLTGPPGVGKTTIAHLAADELDCDLTELKMPVDTAVLSGYVRRLDGILFLDEIHRMPRKQQEEFMHLLNEGFIQRANGMQIENEDLCIIGATTEPQDLVKPFYDRFQFTPQWDPYTAEELAAMILNMQKRRGMTTISEELATQMSQAAGTPRNAAEMVEAARSLFLSGQGVTIASVLELAGLNSEGLSDLHIQYLKMMEAVGGKAGLKTIATIMRLHEKVVTELERYLLEQEMITFSSTGRELTHKGMLQVHPARKKRNRRGTVEER